MQEMRIPLDPWGMPPFPPAAKYLRFLLLSEPAPPPPPPSCWGRFFHCPRSLPDIFAVGGWQWLCSISDFSGEAVRRSERLRSVKFVTNIVNLRVNYWKLAINSAADPSGLLSFFRSSTLQMEILFTVDNCTDHTQTYNLHRYLN